MPTPVATQYGGVRDGYDRAWHAVDLAAVRLAVQIGDRVRAVPVCAQRVPRLGWRYSRADVVNVVLCRHCQRKIEASR
jgi:hypothetical protein